MAQDTVCFGYLAPGEVRQEFCDSIIGTLRYYMERSKKTVRATVSINSGPRVAEGRSQLVDAFAKTRCDWLWMVDSDMVWEADALDRLLNLAHDEEARIVGGLCFGGRADADMFPTIYEFVEEDGLLGTKVVYDYPRNQPMRVAATGAAFLLIHKSVFVEMKKAFGRLPNGRENPYPWFVEASNGGRPFGEDISFCVKARALGIDIWVDSSIRVGHIKTRSLTESAYFEQQARATTLKDAVPPLTLPEVP